MADFSSNLPVGLTGLNLSGVPTTPVNADSNGNMLVKDYADGPVSPGTAAPVSTLIGGQYNSPLPTLSAAQQAAIQLDSSGRILIGSIASSLPAGSNTIGGVTQASGPWTINLTEIGGSAITIGQASMAASLPVVIASNQSAILVTQSGTWTVQQGTPPWTIQGDAASGATTAGNPVLIGGVFNTTQTTVTNGQAVSAQMTARGAQIVATGVDAFNITNITGTITLPTGAATSANQTTMITSLQLIDNPVGPITPGAAGTGSFLSGTVFNTTLPTFTTGQQGATQSNEFGETAVQFRNKYKNITASGATVVKTGAGRLHGISFSQNSGITVTIYDNTAASGTIIALFQSQNMVFVGPLGCEFTTGLTVEQSGSNNITVYYY